MNAPASFSKLNNAWFYLLVPLLGLYALNKLLEARQQLSNLITYMDGKTGAEELVAKLLQDPALLQTLAATKKETPEAGS